MEPYDCLVLVDCCIGVSVDMISVDYWMTSHSFAADYLILTTASTQTWVRRLYSAEGFVYLNASGLLTASVGDVKHKYDSHVD